MNKFVNNTYYVHTNILLLFKMTKSNFNMTTVKMLSKYEKSKKPSITFNTMNR